ncbi:MAG: hypothetical protein R3331_11590 [Sulfurospirillaceae bacterium]|nr:hypothetical protein [Sulfurospirillaceae bacterium]
MIKNTSSYKETLNTPRQMRFGLSLIELIFTIVIIGIVFTVIPKIILSLNKSDSFAIRQDALFNGISMMQMISSMPWDENNTNSNDILHVSSSANQIFDCNSTTHYRIGGFIGSRNCENNKDASFIADFAGTNYFLANNIDEFNNQDINATYYNLLIGVYYIDDNITYSANKAQIVQSTLSVPYTTNLKRIDINITYNGKRGAQGKQIAQFSYVSANIGLKTLSRRVWR